MALGDVLVGAIPLDCASSPCRMLDACELATLLDYEENLNLITLSDFEADIEFDST